MQVYGRLLEALLGAGYTLTPFKQYVSCPHSFDKAVILRHDVDKKPENALQMARIEDALQVKATYYFRIVRESFDAEVMSQLEARGHEIGYHYEDLTLAKGDVEKAEQLFREHLTKFRKVCRIETICMHGSPLSKWDNRLLFESVNYRNFGIVAEPYFDLDFEKILYLTDTGRTWNGEKVGVRDKVDSKFNFAVSSTYEVFRAIKSGVLPIKILLNTHPQRWNNDYLPWVSEYIFQNIKNVLKRGIILMRG